MAQQTTVQKEAQVALTHNKLTASIAKEIITEMATAKQTVMNKQLVVDNRNSWIFVGSKEVPNEIIEALKKSSDDYVYVHVNREEGTLELIDKKKYNDLDWHERMIIYSSILPKIQIESPLVLGIGCDDFVRAGSSWTAATVPAVLLGWLSLNLSLSKWDPAKKNLQHKMLQACYAE